MSNTTLSGKLEVKITSLHEKFKALLSLNKTVRKFWDKSDQRFHARQDDAEQKFMTHQKSLEGLGCHVNIMENQVLDLKEDRKRHKNCEDISLKP